MRKNKSSIWKSGNSTQLFLDSCGCRFRKNPATACIMCNYGTGNNLSPKEAIEEIENSISSEEPIHSLLIGSCGSILDPYEFSNDSLTAILQYLNHMDVEYIIFETHYSTVNDDILTLLKEELPNKKIAIEMGFESSNPNTLQILNKNINIPQLENTIQNIYSYNIDVILNVFFGKPYASTEEQMQDTLDSLKWAYNHEVEECVIFPANIKPDTKLWDLYKSGLYSPVLHKNFIELLSKIPDKILSRVSLSWYGDRQFFGECLESIPPLAPDDKMPLLMTFYHNFLMNRNVHYRKSIIKQIRKEMENG